MYFVHFILVFQRSKRKYFDDYAEVDNFSLCIEGDTSFPCIQPKVLDMESIAVSIIFFIYNINIYIENDSICLYCRALNLSTKTSMNLTNLKLKTEKWKGNLREKIELII